MFDGGSDEGAQIEQRRRSASINSSKYRVVQWPALTLDLLIGEAPDLDFSPVEADPVAVLHQACLHNDLARVSELLGTSSIDAQALNEGLTIACHAGHASITKALLSSGASHEATTVDGGPLHLASQSGSTECVQLLLDASANPDGPQPSASAATPCFVAAFNGHADCLALLINANAVVDMDYNGTTPLHAACKQGHFDCVAQLLQAGADVDEEDPADEAHHLRRKAPTYYERLVLFSARAQPRRDHHSQLRLRLLRPATRRGRARG